MKIKAVVRFAPWLVLGPITGPLSARAFHCFRGGHPILGGLYIALNVEVLIYLPVITAKLMAWNAAVMAAQG